MADDVADLPVIAAESAKKIWPGDLDGDPLNEWRANMRLAYELGFAHGAVFAATDDGSAQAETK